MAKCESTRPVFYRDLNSFLKPEWKTYNKQINNWNENIERSNYEQYIYGIARNMFLIFLGQGGLGYDIERIITSIVTA